ncbi:MAG: flavodoxin domain-containing protein [Anaerolineales bacterium]|nr:flavodoxin domain-containing protein [Anaerolineales bacterium]MCB8952912.1 flavodoxin domain-containing protein [Ardenticatenales bacterium]
MNDRVLITYATKHGATAEIAEKIGQVLGQAGLRADVMSVERVTDLTPYQAVVLGSAVYIGQWRKEAVKFLTTHEAMLAVRPLWLFSSGPTGEGDPAELLQGWRFPEAQKAIIERIQPRDVAVFHGEIDVEDLNLLEKWVSKNVKAPLGDFRDWEAITAWAVAIAEALQPRE